MGLKGLIVPFLCGKPHVVVLTVSRAMSCPPLSQDHHITGSTQGTVGETRGVIIIIIIIIII